MIDVETSILAKFKASLREQDFHPGILGLFINPFYFARKGLDRHITQLAPLLRGKILDVGCGSKPYRRYFTVGEYVGLEITGRNREADVFYDGKVFPFNDGEFDSVFSSEVLEHVFNPGEFLSEINRVLKPGGLLLLTVPFLWDEHGQPFDFARYSSFGLRHLLEGHGFEIVKFHKSMDDVRVIFQMVNAYIYKRTITGSWKLNLFLTAILTAPFNLCGELFAKILPSNADLYLDNIVLARKRDGGRQCA